MIIKLHNSDHLYALVDEEDYASLVNLKWWAKISPLARTVYAHARINGRLILMHRHLLGVVNPEIEIDHFDHNGLNNSRENLRVLTHSQNSHNRILNKNNRSGFRGVDWLKGRQRWRAQVRVGGKSIFQKRFLKFDEACAAVSAAREKYLSYTNESMI